MRRALPLKVLNPMNRTHLQAFALITAVLVAPLAGHGQADLPDAPGVVGAPKAGPVPTGPTVVIDTSMGRLTCKTFDKQAPVAVANFIGLAEGTKDWSMDQGKTKKRKAVLRRPHVPPRDPRLHDPGRRSRRRRHAAARATSSRTRSPPAEAWRPARSRWRTRARTRTAASSSSPRSQSRSSTASTPSSDSATRRR